MRVLAHMNIAAWPRAVAAAEPSGAETPPRQNPPKLAGVM